MILEASEFIKIIKELRSEKGYNDNTQDDMNKINEKYDKTLKSSLNSQKEVNDKIEKLEIDKHKLIEENKRLEEQLSNLEYREKELKEAREQIELFKQQNQSYSNIIYDLKKEIESNQEAFIDTINKYNNTVKTLTDEKYKFKNELDFARCEFNKIEEKYLADLLKFRKLLPKIEEENEKLKEKVEIAENVKQQLKSKLNEITVIVSGEGEYIFKQIQEILNREVFINE